MRLLATDTPSRSTTTLSDTAKISSILWVISITPTPLAFSILIFSSRWAISVSFSAEVGSSRIRMRAFS